MAEKNNVAEIVSMVESLTVLELSELIKALEDKFGVSAAPVAVAAAPAGQAPKEEAEEKTEFDVILQDAGSERIKVLKEVRTITGLGLKEVKELIDNLPKPVKQGISKEDADKIKKTLEAVGAKVEVK